MSSKKTFILLFIYIICNNSCSTSKQSATANLPVWAQNISSDPDYYTGVGYAPKQKSSTAHYEQATNNALNALASEISVQIVSNSVLVSVTDEQKVRDNLSSVVQARSSVTIDGYEKVDSYENKTGYWVYYRLSKQLHAQNELKKKQTAIEMASRKFELALIAENNRNIKQAFGLYAECINAIRQYINEPINASIQGKSHELISESYTRINGILNETKLTVQTPQNRYKMGQNTPQNQIFCTVTYKNKPAINFPIQILYSGEQIHSTHLSNEFGKVGVNISTNSENETETIEFNIDKNELLKQTHVDYTIRKWILAIPTKAKIITIGIDKPTICINTQDTKIKSAFERLFTNKNYPITQELKKADYYVNFKITPHKGGQNNGIYTVLLDGEITTKLNSGKTIYIKRINTIKGMHLNYQEAHEKAHNTLLKQVEVRLFPEIYDVIVKQKNVE